MVETLGLEISDTEKFRVMLGTGKNVKGRGECKEVRLCLGPMEIVENIFLLELGNSNIILGIQWLEKLGTRSTN